MQENDEGKIPFSATLLISSIVSSSLNLLQLQLQMKMMLEDYK